MAILLVDLFGKIVDNVIKGSVNTVMKTAVKGLL